MYRREMEGLSWSFGCQQEADRAMERIRRQNRMSKRHSVLMRYSETLASKYVESAESGCSRGRMLQTNLPMASSLGKQEEQNPDRMLRDSNTDIRKTRHTHRVF